MAKELVYIDANGDKQAANIGLDIVKEASERGVGFRTWFNALHPTNPEKYGTAFEQAMEQCGIFIKGNRAAGIAPSKMYDVLNPVKEANSPQTRDGVPASRILFPPAILSVIEDKLQVNRTMYANAFAGMIAAEASIDGNRFERPVLNFSRPEAAISMPVTQLSLPNVMLSITASDKAMSVPSWALGMEISEQALKITSVDLVGLALGRQAAVEANTRAQGYILSLLNGDADNGIAALSSISGKVVTVNSLDASIANGSGTLSQKAWIKWLTTNALKRTITHVITDIDTAMAIENRSGKPTVMNDNPTSARMDTLMAVVNPLWPANVKVFITQDPNWPAKTIMGFDATVGVQKVSSLSAQYSAVENFALKRSSALRFDSGELYYRLFDEAFEVLTL